MSDIELVIKIPKEDYEGIRHLTNEQLRMLPIEVAETLMRIANGTPVPKGHGKLVDVKEVEEYLNNIQLELDGWGDTDSAIEIAKARMGLDSITPILEADKGHWIVGEKISDGYTCSKCGSQYKEYPISYNYCPNCGSKNEVEE